MRRSTVYRDKLLEAGFAEATQRPFRFYKPVNGEAAWIIHLVEDEYCLMVYYGCHPIYAYDGALDFMVQYCEDMDTCRIRSSLCILSDEDEEKATQTLADFFAGWRDPTKEEIKTAHKERQKAFLLRIKERLKPLGFRKKANTWWLFIGTYKLTFEVQKSFYSDRMYFAICLNAVDSDGNFLHSNLPSKYSSRVTFGGEYCHNWQLLSYEQGERLMDQIVDELSALIQKYSPANT